MTPEDWAELKAAYGAAARGSYAEYRRGFETSLGRLWDNPPRPMTRGEINAFFWLTRPWWRKVAHRLAHLLGLNRSRLDPDRLGRVCNYCGKFTKWSRSGL